MGVVGDMTSVLAILDVDLVRETVRSRFENVLRAMGVAVRGRVRKLLRVAKGASDPGKPPHLHSANSQLEKFVLYSVDPAEMSVVIGPMAVSGGGGGRSLRALEMGGTVLSKGKEITIRPRPFMRPAFEAALMDVSRFITEGMSG